MILRKMLTAVLAGAGMLILILDGQTALSGAAAGVDLCLKTVVPSLFPFLFLCALLTDALWGERIRWLRPLGKFFGIPEGGESLLVAAFLGGYPAGAQAVGDAFRANRLSESDACHLLRFCSNAGPAFLFGMTALQFEKQEWIWAIWVIQIGSALLTGLSGQQNPASNTQLPERSLNISQILVRTVKTMGIICGWIVLFRILTEFLTRWFFWPLSPELSVMLTGLLELSNGCVALGAIETEFTRFLICSGLLSFGGLCVAMQTASVIGTLSLKSYLHGKLQQTLLSLLLSVVYWQWGWFGLLSTGAIFMFVLSRRKKAVDFPGESLYNADITSGRKQHHAVS